MRSTDSAKSNSGLPVSPVESSIESPAIPVAAPVKESPETVISNEISPLLTKARVVRSAITSTNLPLTLLPSLTQTPIPSLSLV